MTLNEVTTLLASQYGKELDMPFKLILAERVRVWRSRLLKNSLDKDQKDRKFFRQRLYLKMETTADTPTCTGFTGCPVAQTINIVPKPLMANNILFDYVGSVNGMNPFQEVISGMGAYANASKYTKNTTKFTWTGEKIQVLNNPRLPYLLVDGIFDNPQEVAAMNCASGQSTDCDFWNQEYPVPGALMQLIIQSITQIDFNRPSVPNDQEVPVSAEPQTQKR